VHDGDFYNLDVLFDNIFSKLFVVHIWNIVG